MLRNMKMVRFIKKKIKPIILTLRKVFLPKFKIKNKSFFFIKDPNSNLFFGYYDISPFSKNSELLLCHKVIKQENSAEILIFDESTNSLDQTTEKSFLRDIVNFKQKKTIIMISHKLSTLENCNKIFEVKNLKINQLK